MIKFNQRELIVPYIILFIVMFVSVYPLLYMVSVSFMTAGEASNQYLIPKELRFETMSLYGRRIIFNNIL